MKKHLYLVSLLWLLAGFSTTSQAQVNWYTPEVRRELGQEVSPNTPAIPPPFRTTEYKLKNCRVVTGTVSYFDTIATYAQGRLVDAIDFKPISGALIEVSHSCFGRDNFCQVKTAITDSCGFFRLGWVGCGGPMGGRANRPLQIKAAGYSLIKTQKVSFGGLAYLHIELVAANQLFIAHPPRR